LRARARELPCLGTLAEPERWKFFLEAAQLMRARAARRWTRPPFRAMDSVTVQRETPTLRSSVRLWSATRACSLRQLRRGARLDADARVARLARDTCGQTNLHSSCATRLSRTLEFAPLRGCGVFHCKCLENRPQARWTSSRSKTMTEQMNERDQIGYAHMPHCHPLVMRGESRGMNPPGTKVSFDAKALAK
jgi:hypothetical protein